MTDWPEGLKTGPIGEWPGAMTPRRTISPFSANLTSTLTLLKRELRELGAKNVEMLIAVPPGAFRQDGRPYANAKPEHPGIILSFDTKAGHLSYPADQYTTWQDNLRAIALSLDALRKVDRYGVTKRGEQYRGFLAIEARPAGMVTSEEQALRFIGAWARLEHPVSPATIKANLRQNLRLAQRYSHPDGGGTAEGFQQVTAAEKYLRENGVL